MVPEFPASTPKAMAKLYCAVILVAGWTLALAALNPPTAQEKLDTCKNVSEGYQGKNYKVIEHEDTLCGYSCIFYVNSFFLETNQKFPDGVSCGQGKECNNGNCLDTRAKEVCKANMPDYTQVDNDRSCFIACSNGSVKNLFQAPATYPCQPPLPCAINTPTTCDEKGHCIPVRDDVTANAQNYPRNNDARAFMDCSTRYTNGAEQYKEKNLELTSASSSKYWCGYSCQFQNMTDKSVVLENYCFPDSTNCTDTTHPNAQEMVCVSGWCQSKALYDTCKAKGFVPQLMIADDCVTLMCNSVDVSYAPSGKTCVDYKNQTQTCDGKGMCGPPIQWK